MFEQQIEGVTPLYLLTHEESKNVTQTLEIHEMFTGTESNYYVPASIAFGGQKAGCWDSPKLLMVSEIVLTSDVGAQQQCL